MFVGRVHNTCRQSKNTSGLRRLKGTPLIEVDEHREARQNQHDHRQSHDRQKDLAPKRRRSQTRKDCPMEAVGASDHKPNEVDVGLKQACHTEMLGSPSATRPDAMRPSAAAKKKGGSTDEMPNTTLIRRWACGPLWTWRKAKNAPRRMRARRAKAKSGYMLAKTHWKRRGNPGPHTTIARATRALSTSQ